MKKSELIFTFIVFSIVQYLITSFVLGEIDFRHWEFVDRVMSVFLTILYTLLYAIAKHLD